MADLTYLPIAGTTPSPTPSTMAQSGRERFRWGTYLAAGYNSYEEQNEAIHRVFDAGATELPDSFREYFWSKNIVKDELQKQLFESEELDEIVPVKPRKKSPTARKSRRHS